MPWGIERQCTSRTVAETWAACTDERKGLRGGSKVKDGAIRASLFLSAFRVLREYMPFGEATAMSLSGHIECETAFYSLMSRSNCQPNSLAFQLS